MSKLFLLLLVLIQAAVLHHLSADAGCQLWFWKSRGSERFSSTSNIHLRINIRCSKVPWLIVVRPTTVKPIDYPPLCLPTCGICAVTIQYTMLMSLWVITTSSSLDCIHAACSRFIIAVSGFLPQQWLIQKYTLLSYISDVYWLSRFYPTDSIGTLHPRVLMLT